MATIFVMSCRVARPMGKSLVQNWFPPLLFLTSFTWPPWTHPLSLSLLKRHNSLFWSLGNRWLVLCPRGLRVYVWKHLRCFVSGCTLRPFSYHGQSSLDGYCCWPTQMLSIVCALCCRCIGHYHSSCFGSFSLFLVQHFKHWAISRSHWGESPRHLKAIDVIFCPWSYQLIRESGTKSPSALAFNGLPWRNHWNINHWWLQHYQQP